MSTSACAAARSPAGRWCARMAEPTLAPGIEGQAANAAIRSFTDLARDDVEWAGGKGANLGELTRAGLPVPPGFVVGAPAYAAFCEASELRDRLAASARGTRRRRHRALEACAEQARALVLGDADAGRAGPGDPRRLRRAVRPTGMREQARSRCAPRRRRRTPQSASFAGMNETLPERARRRRGGRRRAPLLGVAVRRPHDLLPRQARLRPGRHGHRGRRPAPDRLATRAGVMFTIDPSSGARDRLVIEGVVRARRGGRLRPRLARPLRRRQGRRCAILAREVRAQGARDRAAPPAAARARELEPEEALAPGAERRRRSRSSPTSASTIEQHYGAPQDTEWAFDADGTLWMLQSRPVTTVDRAARAATAPAADRGAVALAARPRRRAGRRERAGARPRLARGRRLGCATATCSSRT